MVAAILLDWGAVLRFRRFALSLAALAGIVLQGLTSAACGPTLLEQLTPTPGVPTSSQYVTALLTPGASTSSTFTLSAATTVVGVTLASVVSNTTGNVLAPTMSLVLGTQTSATTCAPLSTQPATPALSAQIQQSLGPGTYCVALTGTGLGEAAVVVVRINTSATPPTTTASPTAGDVFLSTVGPQGTSTHELPIAFNGSTTVSLTGAGATNVNTIGVGFGVWDGVTCRLNTFVTSAPAVNPLITVTVDPGNYCVTAADVGQLTAPIIFSITTIHP